jgi:uncharacterized protein YhfF
MTPSPIQQFWLRYLDSLPPDAPRPEKYQAWHFADNPADADWLADLVKKGIKKATASLGWVFEWQMEPYPQPGDLSVITNWVGDPLCVIETTGVQIVPFEQVDAEFAAEEGEGSRTLEEWRRVHWQIFTRECTIIERQPSPDMPVVCERFRLLYREE